MKHILTFIGLFLIAGNTFSQGLEGIIVETCHVADSNDFSLDPDISPGTVTYRIYADMAEGYHLQALYGLENHPLVIKTSTKFYNNALMGAKTGDKINYLHLGRELVALDSWLTIGRATVVHEGVERQKDTDGSIVRQINGLRDLDGLISAEVAAVTDFQIDLSPFEGDNDGLFESNNGSLASLNGMQGSTPENKVLLAQITTDGILSFELNIQIRSAKGKVENYVARNPVGPEIQYDDLIFDGSQAGSH